MSNFFQSSCVILYFHKQCMRISVAPHPHNVFYFLFDCEHYKCLKWYLMAALICISFVMNDAEHLFRYFSPFVYLLLWNIWSNILQSFIRLLILLLSCKNTVSILNTILLPAKCISNIFTILNLAFAFS